MMLTKPKRIGSSSQLRRKIIIYLISFLLFFTLINGLQLISISSKFLYHIDPSPNISNGYEGKVQESFDTMKANSGQSMTSSILNYGSWHHENRECIVRSSCHLKMVKALVWKCPNAPKKCGGVGDRLRGIQFAFLLAVITKRMFFIQWGDDPYPLLDALTPAEFDWNLPSNISTDSWSLLPWFYCIRPRPCTEGILPSDERLPLPDQSGPDINLLSDDVPYRLNDYGHLLIIARPRPRTLWNLLNNRRSITTNVTMTEMHESEVEKLLLKTIFKPSAHVSKRISSIMPHEVRTTGYVAVHTRTGLDVHEGQTSRFRNLNYNLTNTAKLMLSCAVMTTNGKLENVFLASDSAEFKKAFAQLAKKRNINVFYSSARTMHLDHVKRGYYRNMTKDERWMSFISVFIDFFILSEGRLLITNGSGFSRMAFNIGHASRLVELKERLTNCHH